MFPSISAARVFLIAQLLWIANHQSHYGSAAHKIHEKAAFFSTGTVSFFIIVKSCSKFRFCFVKIGSPTTYLHFKRWQPFRNTVMFPTFNLKFFTRSFGGKSICIAYKVRKVGGTHSQSGLRWIFWNLCWVFAPL